MLCGELFFSPPRSQSAQRKNHKEKSLRLCGLKNNHKLLFLFFLMERVNLPRAICASRCHYLITWCLSYSIENRSSAIVSRCHCLLMAFNHHLQRRYIDLPEDKAFFFAHATPSKSIAYAATQNTNAKQKEH